MMLRRENQFSRSSSGAHMLARVSERDGSQLGADTSEPARRVAPQGSATWPFSENNGLLE